MGAYTDAKKHCILSYCWLANDTYSHECRAPSELMDFWEGQVLPSYYFYVLQINWQKKYCLVLLKNRV